ncbi:MAG TPA: 50S ribosomal protein L4 [Gammaproteobacteria bacterium]|nr:50S ribosomal protein L4 [Gammaproteobacteria bacterium]HIM05974.1 50S ribosomal protein L4 [Gammaproteobacteria bacterium]
MVKLDGTTGQQLAVSEDVFATAFREPLVHQVVVAYMSGTRSGTSSQKNRSAVSGGGSKPWRQKGTGRARAGTIRSPIWRGGGRAFPATARSYSQKVNRKMYRAALRSILSELIRQERLRVCDEIQVSQPKTKVMTDVLAKLGLSGRVLLVTADYDQNVSLSARNLPGVEVVEAAQVNPVSLVGNETVVLTADALRKVEASLQ